MKKCTTLPVLFTILISTAICWGQNDKPQPDSQIPESVQKSDKTHEPILLVEGQITDAMGVGQVDVKITARVKSGKGQSGAVLAESTTDRFGDFKLTTEKPFEGDIVLTLAKPLYVNMFKEYTIRPGEPPPFVAETMEGNVVVIGRVVDQKNEQAVGGASVTLKASEREWKDVTKPDGTFTLRNVVPGEGSLTVDAEGYGREQQGVKRLEDFGELLIKLKPEKVLTLLVQDTSDQPIPKATVEILDQRRNDLRTAVTDEKGVVVFHGLSFDTYVLHGRLTHDSFVSDADFVREIDLPEGILDVHDKLQMTRAGKLHGTVTSKVSGEPIYGARIMTGSGDATPRDWTDFQGHYEIDGVPPGRTVITIHMSDFAPDLQYVDIKAGEETQVDFSLDKGAIVTGRVEDEEGNPIAGAYIDATKWRKETTLGLRTIADAKGRFSFTSAPHDAFEVDAYARDTERVSTTISADTDQPIVITLAQRKTPSGGPPGPLLQVGDSVPDITVRTIDGQSLELASMKGKLIVVDFWATWCSPCVADMPYVKKAFAEFGGRDDVVMISISLDNDVDILKRFVKRKDMKWHQVCGEPGGVPEAMHRFGVEGVPAVFIIGKDGKVAQRHVLGDELVESIEAHLSNE